MTSRLPSVVIHALALIGLIWCLSWLRPLPVVSAQGGFSGVQFTRSDGGLYFFDSRSGELWIYDEARRMPLWHFRMTKLGAPLEKISLTGRNLEELRQLAPAQQTPPPASPKR